MNRYYEAYPRRSGLLTLPPPPLDTPSKPSSTILMPSTASVTGVENSATWNSYNSEPIQRNNLLERIKPERERTRLTKNISKLQWKQQLQQQSLQQQYNNFDMNNMFGSMTINDVSPRFALKRILLLYENLQYREVANFINRLSHNTFKIIINQLPIDLFIDQIPNSLNILEALYGKIFLSSHFNGIKLLKPENVLLQIVRILVNTSNNINIDTYIGSIRKLIKVIVLSEPKLRKTLQLRKRILDKSVEGLGQHGLVDENNNKLEKANATIQMLEQFLKEEKRKSEELRKEVKLLQPSLPTNINYSACDKLMEFEKKEKENLFKKIDELCYQLTEVTNERDFGKQSYKEMKAKMTDLINIKNDLVQQNKALLYQRDTCQCLLVDKDKQINKLRTYLDKDILKEPIVVQKISSISEDCRKLITSLKTDVENLNLRNKELEDVIASREVGFKNLCRTIEGVKRDRKSLVTKLEGHIAEKEQNVISLLEGTKAIKNELLDLKDKIEKQEQETAQLKEERLLNDAEITVLGEAKLLYEDKIKEFQHEKNAMCQIAAEFECQIEFAKNMMKDLDGYKYAIERQLNEAREELQRQKETNYIQEKILEESRETVKMLRCRMNK